ncbi:hypothetical protein NMG60_11016373 [Bertholletia excelsa]
MSFNLTKGLIVLVAASMLAVASRADTIVVGGSENWRSGFNYTDWALKHGPFYLNDVLVFKYGAPSDKTPAHNVYLLPNLWSYINCDFSGAKLLAGPTQGGGDGFKYELKMFRPLYFASSDDGDCEDGLMKFFVVPLPRWQG